MQGQSPWLYWEGLDDGVGWGKTPNKPSQPGVGWVTLPTNAQANRVGWEYSQPTRRPKTALPQPNEAKPGWGGEYSKPTRRQKRRIPKQTRNQGWGWEYSNQRAGQKRHIFQHAIEGVWGGQSPLSGVQGQSPGSTHPNISPGWRKRIQPGELEGGRAPSNI